MFLQIGVKFSGFLLLELLRYRVNKIYNKLSRVMFKVNNKDTKTTSNDVIDTLLNCEFC